MHERTTEAPGWLRLLGSGLAWSIIGAVVGVAGLLVTLHRNTPDLRVVVTNESNVFDVHQVVAGLKVEMNGEDLLEQRRNLRLVSVTVRNDGDAALLPTALDSSVPWGIEIANANVIEARVARTSSQYLREQLHLTIEAPSKVLFSSFIVDPGESVALDILVLHDASVEPRVGFLGKVAGTSQVPVESASGSEDQDGLWSWLSRGFEGTAAIQVIRVVGYSALGLISFVVLIVALVASGNTIESIASWRRRRKFAAVVERSKEVRHLTWESLDAVRTLYVAAAEAGVSRLLATISTKDRLERAVRTASARHHPPVGHAGSRHGRTETETHGYMVSRTDEHITRLILTGGVMIDAIERLVSDGVIQTPPDAAPEVQPAFVSALRELAGLLGAGAELPSSGDDAE